MICTFLLIDKKELHYLPQANTGKNKKVLSSVLIGWQLLQRPEIRFKIKDFNLSKMVLGFTGQESKLAC
jgi:hypothetical protein